MIDKSILLEYEESLIGKKAQLTQYYFSYSNKANMQLALEIMRYSFNTYLKWNPWELRDWLTIDILERLKLRHLLKYIDFPAELDRETDLFYIAWLLYPETIHFSKYDLILRVYQNLLDKKIKKYPKEFFSGIYGVYRASICLKYMIEQYLTFSNIEDLYQFFSTDAVFTVLRKYKLIVICRDLFGTPLAFLHQSLPEEQQSELLYYYYKYQNDKANIDNDKEQDWEFDEDEFIVSY